MVYSKMCHYIGLTCIASRLGDLGCFCVLLRSILNKQKHSPIINVDRITQTALIRKKQCT